MRYGSGMKWIREARLARGLLLTQLADVCGIDFRRLSDYERGRRRPSADVLSRIAAALQFNQDVAPPADAFLSPREYRRLAPRSAVMHVDEGPSYLSLLGRSEGALGLQGYAPPQRWWGLGTRTDSSPELTSLTSLLVSGARERVASPVRLRFEEHALLAENGRGLGLAERACLWWKADGREVFYFPQVTMLVGEWVVRVDALVGIFTKAGPVWCVVEIDGPGHAGRGQWDRRRDGLVRMPVLRFPSGEVTVSRFAQELAWRLRALFGGTRADCG